MVQLKNPLAPATEKQLGIISRLTTQDRPRLKANPDGLTMQWASDLIGKLLKAKKWGTASAKPTFQVNAEAVEAVFTKADIVAGLMKHNNSIPSELQVNEVYNLLKAKGHRVELTID